MENESFPRRKFLLGLAATAGTALLGGAASAGAVNTAYAARGESATSLPFETLVSTRYSLRQFSPQPVEAEKLARILEAGRLAPTAANGQPQRIFVMQSADALQKVRSLTRMVRDAPVVLLVCYDTAQSWKATLFDDDYESGPTDAAIVTTLMMMQATELGVGSLWARGFNAQQMHDQFALPADLRVAALLMLGYPADADVQPSTSHFRRKPLEETVSWL